MIRMIYIVVIKLCLVLFIKDMCFNVEVGIIVLWLW